jgi:hypothetical protein
MQGIIFNQIFPVSLRGLLGVKPCIYAGFNDVFFKLILP